MSELLSNYELNIYSKIKEETTQSLIEVEEFLQNPLNAFHNDLILIYTLDHMDIQAALRIVEMDAVFADYKTIFEAIRKHDNKELTNAICKRFSNFTKLRFESFYWKHSPSRFAHIVVYSALSSFTVLTFALAVETFLRIVGVSI